MLMSHQLSFKYNKVPRSKMSAPPAAFLEVLCSDTYLAFYFLVFRNDDIRTIEGLLGPLRKEVMPATLINF